MKILRVTTTQGDLLCHTIDVSGENFAWSPVAALHVAPITAITLIDAPKDDESKPESIYHTGD